MPEATRSTFPPGDQGPKLLGQLVTFTKNEPLFTLKQFRKFGPIFSTTLAGRQVCFLAGAEGLAIFYDEDYVLRAPVAPKNLMSTTWGYDGAHGLPPLDGERHRRRKRNFLRTTTLDKTEHYLKVIGHRLREICGDWRSRETLCVADDADRAILSMFAEVFFGTPFAGEDGDRVVKAIRQNFRVFNGGLRLDLPFTRLGRAQRAADEVLYPYFRQALEAHRESPEHFDDAVSTYLTGEDVDGFTDGEILTDFHQFFIGSYGVTTRIPGLVHNLAHHPEVVERLREEIQAHRETFEAPPTLQGLRRFSYTNRVVRETLRTWPGVPVVLGQAARDIQLNGHTIPQGTTVFGCLYATCQDDRVYSQPERFDPDRFSPERNEGAGHPELASVETAFGFGDNTRTHKCAGLWVALATLELVVLHLAENWNWQLADPEVDVDMGQLPVAFDDGLLLKRV